MPTKGKTPVKSIAEGIQTRSKSTQPETFQEGSEATPTMPRGTTQDLSDENTDNNNEEDIEDDSEIEQRRRRLENITKEVVRRKALRNKKKAVQTCIAELEALDKQIRLLEGQLQQSPLAEKEEEEDDDDEQEQGAKRRRANTAGDSHREPVVHRIDTETQATSPRKPPKLPTLPEYHGKTIAEAQSFIRQSERVFRQDAGYYYPSDQSKIDTCVGRFKEKPRRKWDGREDAVGIRQTTWKEFKDWMLDSIQDKGNRVVYAANKIQDARQRQNQSIDDFVYYLDTYRSELARESEASRFQTLFAKLRPKNQIEALRMNPQPRTRLELIEAVRRFETIERLQANVAKKNTSSGETKDSRRGSETYPSRPRGDR